MHSRLSGSRATSPQAVFTWPIGLTTGACLLVSVLLVGVMIMLTGQLRGAHFFARADQECSVMAAYGQTLKPAKIDPVLRQNVDNVTEPGEVGINDLDCRKIFQASGLDVSPDCQPRAGGLCVPFQIVFGRALPNTNTGDGFTVEVEWRCAGLCGFGHEVDFVRSPVGEWKAVREREVWIS